MLMLCSVFHRPEEGYYDSDDNQGKDNTNDAFYWSFDTDTSDPFATSVGEGQIFVFQFPSGYNADVDGTVGLRVREIGPRRSWQSTTRPILTNGGRSMYWAQARGENRCWVGAQGNNTRRFSRSDTNTIRLDRRSGAPWKAADAPPTLSSHPSEPAVYGSGASNQFFRFNYDYSESVVVSTDSFVSSRSVVTPDDQYVFYGTQGGFLYQADGEDLATVWNSGGAGGIPIDGIEGDLAVHPNGLFVYVAETSGFGTGDVIAIRIALPLGGTESPTAGPTLSPTAVPTAEPTAAPSKKQTPEPSVSPSSFPSTTVPTTVPPTTPQPTGPLVESLGSTSAATQATCRIGGLVLILALAWN